MALLIVSVKLYYPFDDLHRSPRSPTEPAVFTIDWNKWNKVYENSEESQYTSGVKVGKQDVVNVTEKDVFNMTNDELDKYMDWYQKTWVETGRRFGKGESKNPIIY